MLPIWGKFLVLKMFSRHGIQCNLKRGVFHCIPEPRAQDPSLWPEVSPGRHATKEGKCLQVHTLLTVWLQQGRSLLQKSISSPGGIQSEYQWCLTCLYKWWHFLETCRFNLTIKFNCHLQESNKAFHFRLVKGIVGSLSTPLVLFSNWAFFSS